MQKILKTFRRIKNGAKSCLGFACVDFELNGSEAEGSGDCVCVCECNCAPPPPHPISATVFHLLEASRACGFSGCSHGKWAARFLPCSTWRLGRPSNIGNLPLQQSIQVLWKTGGFKAAVSISSWSHCWLSLSLIVIFFLSWGIRGIQMAHALLWS